MAKAAKEETKVTEMENKIEKMTQFLADNKIECFDIQKMDDEHHTTIFRSRMEVKGQLLPMALLMDDSVYMLLQVQIAPQVIDEEKLKSTCRCYQQHEQQRSSVQIHRFRERRLHAERMHYRRKHHL